MATLNIDVQHIDSLLPAFGRQGGVKISCDMCYRDIEDIVAQFREQLTEEDWLEVINNTE